MTWPWPDLTWPDLVPNGKMTITIDLKIKNNPLNMCRMPHLPFLDLVTFHDLTLTLTLTLQHLIHPLSPLAICWTHYTGQQQFCCLHFVSWLGTSLVRWIQKSHWFCSIRSSFWAIATSRFCVFVHIFGFGGCVQWKYQLNVKSLVVILW